jgi:hypothetical protein
MVMGVGHSIAFHIDATGEDKTETIGGREGIWWLPNATAISYLILTNQGENPLQTTLSVSDASGKNSTQTIAVPPRGMQRYSMRQIVAAAKLAGSYGGIEVAATGAAGSMDTLHVVFDQSGGLSAVMKMFDYDPRVQLKERDFAGTGKWTLRAPMLALSNPDPSLAFPEGTVLQPQLFIRNVTAKPVDGTLAFNWRTATATGPTQPSAIHLSPYETRRIDVAALQDGKTLPQDAQWASVILTTNSLPEEVVAVSASYDKSLRYGAQTPFSDQLAFHWAGSQWQYDPYHNSIVTVGNGGAKPTQAAFTIFYNQGTQKYELDQTLQPGEQMWMDIGKLIRGSIPDKNGNTLPLNLTSGSYEIRDLTNKFAGTLFEGKLIYDKTYGHVTYGCGACCGYTTTYFFSNPLSIPFQGTADQAVWAHDTCDGGLGIDVNGAFDGGYSVTNTGIATVAGLGVYTGVGVGSTTSAALGDLQINEPRENCPVLLVGPTGTINTVPVITGISPAAGLVGNAESVTITGSGFSSPATINAGTNISVSSTTVVSPTEITATFTPTNSTSAGGNQGVTASINSGSPSNSVNFYVQIPTHVARVSAPGVAPAGPVTNGVGPLVTSTNMAVQYPNGGQYQSYTSVCGGYQWYAYDVEDQQSNPITDGTMTITESFSDISPSPDPLTSPTGSSVTVSAPNNLIIGDISANFNNAPSCPPASVGDSYNQQFTATVGGVQYNTVTTVIHITRSTNSQGLPTFTSTITTP